MFNWLRKKFQTEKPADLEDVNIMGAVIGAVFADILCESRWEPRETDVPFYCTVRRVLVEPGEEGLVVAVEFTSDTDPGQVIVLELKDFLLSFAPTVEPVDEVSYH